MVEVDLVPEWLVLSQRETLFIERIRQQVKSLLGHDFSPPEHAFRFPKFKPRLKIAMDLWT
jgi:hypothetical protein